MALEESTDAKGAGTSKQKLAASNTVASETPPNRIDRCRYSMTPWWKTILEVAGIVAVICYTIFAGFQTRYAHRQAVAAVTASEAATKSLERIDQQFQLDQRPRMSIVGFRVDDVKDGKPMIPTIGKPLVVNIYIKNIGKSPALDVITHRHLLFGSNISQFRIDPSDGTLIGTVVDADGVENTTAASISDTFANETVDISPSELINWDGSEIVVFGRVSYSDSFGNSYCTPFMSTFLRLAKNWLNLPMLSGPKIPTHHVRELCPKGLY